ncbi:MAG TPA: DUF2617 family protein [Actinospica sp.]|jgi:hypothetical protein|nr:DUF2617 family protein [Actinospica sp.]
MPEPSFPARQDWVELVVPYRDTRAQDLCWSLTLPVQPALAARTVRLGGLVLELRLLGASHQVLAWAEAGSELLCVETVACLPGLAEPLAARSARLRPSDGYAFESVVRTLDPPDFDAAVARIGRALAAAGGGLGGCYPGAPGALTAVLPEPARSGVRWTTWHSYPQEGRLVRTRTGFRRTLSQRQRGSSGNQGEGLDGVRSYGAGPPPVAVVSARRP